LIIVYLLDTNIVSELRKRQPHGGVAAWLRSLDQRDLYISAVTLGELQAGVEITRDQDATKAAEIEAWVDQILETSNVLPMDAATFRMSAKLMHRRSNDLFEDAMIAATARVHGLKVATRNVKDFKQFDVEVFNPYGPR
jgi:predicted nucleic acid-binding protein